MFFHYYFIFCNFEIVENCKDLLFFVSQVMPDYGLLFWVFCSFDLVMTFTRFKSVNVSLNRIIVVGIIDHIRGDEL